ncbi:XRE family transcriptional regulator [Aliiroseovarius sp.]|uniref:XRE family transcriptional regulator n=1 Tax=Aliiroseovarius sp. TaxID=1872442 RepID=UPI003BAA122F
MFHKTGNTFHRTGQGAVSSVEYREAISAALSQELVGAGRAAKTIIRWTDVTERTAKNWISGSYGPAGEHLIELMRHSDTVLAVVLELAGRQEVLLAERIKLARQELANVLSRLDEICGGPTL